MSFTPSHRSSASLSANQAPPARAPSPFANKLRNNPPSSLLPAIPPPAPLGLPDMETISLSSNRSKPTPIPPRRSASPLRTQAFDRSMDPEFDDDEEAPWGERPLPRPMGSSPASGPPAVTRFANTFANRMNSLFNSDAQLNGSASGQRLTDAELEAEAERAREQSRREAERILTEEAEARRRAEEQELAQRAQRKAQMEQQQRVMERAQLGRPTTPTRGMSLSPVASPKREKEGESSWWGMAKSKLTPTKEKEKEMTPAQQIIAEARGKEKEKGKNSTGGSADWPALPLPGVRSTDPTLLAMAAASRLAASPRDDSSSFLAGGLSSSPEQPRTYSPKPIMPHEQLAREIEAQGGGRVSGDLFGTRLSNDGGLTSSPKTPGPSLPFANRATPSPAPSPLQPARAQTSPAQIGLTNLGTPLMGRSPNISPDKSPNAEKDKKLSPSDTEKERDRRAMTTSTSATTDDGAPPLYAQFTPAGALDIPLTLLTIARRFEKLEKWTVGHVRALEERMKDVERYLVEKDTKSDTMTKEIGLLKAGIQDVRRSMESLRESIPPPAPAQPPPPPPQPSQPAQPPQTINLNPPTTPVRPRHDQSAANRARAMSSTSASSYATALSALNGDTSNAAAVRMSVISLGSVEADGIETRPSVAEVVTPLASRQPLPPVPSMTNSLTASNSSLGSPPSSSSRRFSSPSGSGSREFKPVPGAAKEFSPPPPMARVPSLTGSQPTSPPSALRSRLPYPSGDYTSNGQAVTPLAAAASAFPMPPGASSSSVTLSGTAPLNIKSSETDKDKEEPVDKATPLALPSTRALRPEPVSPTPRKRYTVALSGGDERPHSMPTQTATFTSSPTMGSDASQLRSPPSAGRARSHSSFGAPQPPPSPTPTTSSRLRRTVSSSNDGSGGLAAVFAQTEDWEDVREKVISPRLANGAGEAKFVDPLVIRRKGAGGGNGNGNKPLPGAGRGKVPISQLVKFFDGDNK